jgi:phosphatidylethanolamine/phosphatidyl-N-methylethanolamine N-methyltransferase
MTASVKPAPLKPASLADNLRFLRALIARPKKIGAITPSSPALGAAIARQIDPEAGPVLEVGPGTGVLTEAILARGVPPAALTLIEYDEDFARHNAARFPDVSVIQGDACQLEALLAPRDMGLFGAIVSGIPLLNFPTAWRQTYMQGLVARLKPGAPLIQFSYGTQAPVVPPPGHTVVRAAMVWSNIPPARVWVYRKA